MIKKHTPRRVFFIVKLLKLNHALVPLSGCFVTHKVNHSSRYVGKTEVAVVCFYGVRVLSIGVVIDDAGNLVECVACLSLHLAVL